MICRLCQSDSPILSGKNKQRIFYYCERCGLIFVPEKSWVSYGEEKIRYEQHNNTLDNLGYVDYLNQIVGVVNKLEKKSPNILDFGSGKEAVLTMLLRADGFECTAYDPLFDRNLENNGLLYDIIILCEVIEHLRNIPTEIERIKSLLKNDGVLIIRTRLYPSVELIENWWYAQDKTHINFFAKNTIDEIAKMINRYSVILKAEDIFVIE